MVVDRSMGRSVNGGASRDRLSPDGHQVRLLVIRGVPIAGKSQVSNHFPFRINQKGLLM